MKLPDREKDIMHENTSPGNQKIVFDIPSTEPAEHKIIIPSFIGEANPERQAIKLIMNHRIDMWEAVTEWHDTDFANAVRQRDYHRLPRIADARNRYLLICWFMVMSSPGICEALVPYQPKR